MGANPGSFKQTLCFHPTATLTHMVNLHRRDYFAGVTGEPTDNKFNLKPIV